MGYRGKLVEQAKARELRAEGWVLADIAAKLGVAKSSVSLWVRDVPFEPSPRRTGPRRRPHSQRIAKLREIEDLDAEGVVRLQSLDDHALLAAGTALYAGEGSKTDCKVCFANSDSRMVTFFCAWLRRFFIVDESRLRVRVYLHHGLDLEAATEFWSGITGVPPSQFGKPYRAVPDPTIRTTKHSMGCVYVIYNCCRTHRQIMGLVRALLGCDPFRGGEIGITPDC